MSSNQSEPLKDLADEELVECFQASGEKACFEELWRRYAPAVYAKSLSFLRNSTTAEDVTAEVFLKLTVGLRDQYRTHNFKAWLFTVAKHECINYVKEAAQRLRSYGTGDLDMAFPGEPGVSIDVQTILGKLPRPQRIALKLFYINGYTYEEIAAIEGWPVKEVKAHIQNGRRMFKLLWDRAAEETKP